ncbi:MAG: potassium-transporting ATPase subunit KdpA [Candidatus Obscuribacter sp.]|nr:potassium-transporting ATPase subunit KdpA [Candidatus Melainabacteria bacterium]MDX1986401.1 potassium-transporting ATPase subunit KdpA [Candidatus Obscuribacter sp.]
MSSADYSSSLLQIAAYIVLLALLCMPLGRYMAAVYEGRFAPEGSVIYKFEGLLYKLCRVVPTREMNWSQYACAMLIFNALGMILVYLLQRAQNLLPFNPEALAAVPADLAFNTAVSFASNTNWQNYGGETTLSYGTQMLALTVQNFLSASTGMAVLVAFIRAFVRQDVQDGYLGNFFVDLCRSVIYILLPLSLALAVFLVGQGCPQTLASYAVYEPLETAALSSGAADGKNQSVESAKVKLALGPVASQVAIKQLGTNGGGFYNVNSSHPLENPTPLSNLVQLLAILLIPAGLCHTFGVMVAQPRQGHVLLLSMTAIFVVALGTCFWAENSGSWQNPAWNLIDGNGLALPANMEGKEVRFGVVNSVLWAVATTAASNGSVNSMHDSMSALGGLVPMFLMQLGEVVFGGVGCGLYGMLVFALITVFIAGLMVGRTPEYLGKKIESFEMKMCSLVILIPPLVVLLGTALAVSLPVGQGAVFNTGPHAFSEILYAFSSAGNNNGSAFGGLSGNSPFYNFSLGTAMFLARYWLAVPVLALAGALVGKKRVPAGNGTMPTDTPLFAALLVGVVLVFGGLTFVPALSLGPVVEHLLMVNSR